MSWQIAANIREIFVDLVATDGTQLFLSRAMSRKDQLLNGFSEALSFLPSFSDAQLSISSDFEKISIREHWGSSTAFLATEGFESLLEIGDHRRLNLFGLSPKRSTPIITHGHSFGITHRMTPEGQIETELDPKEIDFLIEKLKLAEIKSCAIGLLHSDKNSAQEKQLAERLRARDFHAVCSSDFQGDELARAELAAQKAFCLPHLVEFQEGISKLGFELANIQFETNRSFNFSGQAEVQVIFLEDRIQAQIHDGKEIVASQTLQLNPLSLVFIDEEGLVHIGPEAVESEPGPAAFGKGLKLSALDLLINRSKLTSPDLPKLKLDALRVQKMISPLSLQLKIHAESCIESFSDLFYKLIASELRTFLLTNGIKKFDRPIVAMGWLGEILAPPIAKHLKFSKLLFPEHFQFQPLLSRLQDRPKVVGENIRSKGVFEYTDKGQYTTGKIYELL